MCGVHIEGLKLGRVILVMFWLDQAGLTNSNCIRSCILIMVSGCNQRNELNMLGGDDERLSPDYPQES